MCTNQISVRATLLLKKGHVLIVQMKALHVVLLTLCRRLKHFFAYISVISKFYPKSNFTTLSSWSTSVETKLKLAFKENLKGTL